MTAIPLTACGRTSVDETLPPIKYYDGPTVSLDKFVLTGSEPDPDGISLTGVNLAQDGAMIQVNFKGPVLIITKWNQGDIIIVDESLGKTYDIIPTSGILGALLSKPRVDGQPGLCMLASDGAVKPGSAVTVILGNYKRLHVIVK